MKKSFLPFLALSLVFLFLFTGAYPANRDAESRFAGTNSVRAILAGEWRYTFGDNARFALPMFDDSDWATVGFPVSGFRFDLKKSDIAWFRKEIAVFREGTLGFYTGKLPDASQVFFNGTLIGTSGSMSPEKFFGTLSIPRYFVIPGALVKNDGKNVIAIRVQSVRVMANFGGMFLSGLQDAVGTYQADYFLNVIVPMIASILSVFVSIYFLFLFIREPENRFNLFIAIAFPLMAVYYSNLFIENSPISYLLTNKLQFMGLYLGVTFFVFYFQDFYKIHNRDVIKAVLLAVSLVCCGVLLSARDYPTFDILNGKVFYMGLVTPLMLYGMGLSVAAIIRGNRYARFYFLGLLFVFLSGLRDILLVAFDIQPRYWMSAFGMNAFILTLFFTSASWSVDIHKESVEVNRNLEENVRKRTRELREAYSNLDSAYRTIQSDLVVAKKIQGQILPKIPEKSKHLNSAVKYLPMGEVGGDIYDIVELTPGYFRVFLADATGHGVQAALITMIIKSEYERSKELVRDPAELFRQMNREFIDTYKSFALFYTAFLADIDLITNRLHYCSAGHPEQFLLTGQGVTPLGKSGKPIGFIEEPDYVTRTVELEKEFKLFLYTDGLTEEFNQKGEEFGEQRLLEALGSHGAHKPGELAETIMKKLYDYMNGSSVNDDLTMIILERNEG